MSIGTPQVGVSAPPEIYADVKVYSQLLFSASRCLASRSILVTLIVLLIVVSVNGHSVDIVPPDASKGTL